MADKGKAKADAKADPKGDKAAKPKAEAKAEAKVEVKPKAEVKTQAAPPAAGARADDGKERVPFRKFYYRGLEVPSLLDLKPNELLNLMHSRARRRFARGKVNVTHFLRKVRKAKKAALEGKPTVVKTHMRNIIIMPEMVHSVVGVYNGLNFTQVEIKPDMIGHYLGEFAITYKPVKHGKPGQGATGGSKFIPIK